ncbi:MAG: Ig-like domain-containing protein [Terracidiphilus sp.]
MGSSMGRGLRLQLVAGLAFALAVPVLAQAAGNAQSEATQTALSIETHDRGGRTMADFEVTVSGEDGLPATGAVAIEENGSQLAGDVLDAQGHAKLALDLPGGDHMLRAVYRGDATHQGSVSEATGVHAEASATPDFSISVSPATLSLPLGQSGSVTASIRPVNNSTLTAPMFVTLSCQGLPDESSCTFTPENIEILASSCPDPSLSSCPIKSTMVIETQLGTGSLTASAKGHSGGAVAWAILLPGGLVLLGLGWRRRDWRGRSSLLLFLGLISALGVSACNERYNYFNHGPPHNPATPAGTYKVTISAQSNNGITAVTHTTTIALTIQ